MNLKNLLALLVVLLFSQNSHAYIDPGSGSIIIQVLIASFVGIAYTVKVFWRQIIEFGKKVIKFIKKKK